MAVPLWLLKSMTHLSSALRGFAGRFAWPLHSLEWKGKRLFLLPILSHSGDKGEMLRVAAIVPGCFLVPSQAFLQKLLRSLRHTKNAVFITAITWLVHVMGMLLWTCRPTEGGRDLACKANCRDS